MENTKVSDDQPKSINAHEVLVEYNKIEEQCRVLQDQLREKTEEIQRLKQSILISTGAKITLARLLGKNPSSAL